MKDGTILWKSIEPGETQSIHNPLDRVIVHKRTIPVTTEFEINYEKYAGQLTVPIHIFVSKFGILVTDQHPAFQPNEINITWEQLDEMRKEFM